VKQRLIPLSTKAIYLTWLIQVSAKCEPGSMWSRIASQVVSSRFLETCHGRFKWMELKWVMSDVGNPKGSRTSRRHC